MGLSFLLGIFEEEQGQILDFNQIKLEFRKSSCFKSSRRFSTSNKAFVSRIRTHQLLISVESRDYHDPEIPGFGQIFQSRNTGIEVSESRDHEIKTKTDTFHTSQNIF